DSESASLVSRANSSEQTQESQPNEGAPQPPNEMAKRLLDVAQTATCQPRSIRVDEWAGTFDAEKRKKLEIAIDPVLSRLDELLSQAQDMTEPLKAAVTSAEGLQSSHAEPLAGAIDRVTESQRVIADLRSRTEGTPYAFVGLQLQN